MAPNDQPDLAELAGDYRIVGELGGRDEAQVALATRKSDDVPVLIVVQREPAGDAGNALSHLASDAKLLAGGAHPNMVRVLDGRWLGDSAFAMVIERVTAPSLEERLTRRDEAFPFPRIAAILRETNAAIEWARDHGVVHRTLGAGNVFVEEGSDRVKVLFAARALPANSVPNEGDDARTIAGLARAMLTRSVMDPERDRLPLAELRPGLPSSLIQQTEALTGRADSLAPVDVRAYIASIAMAEELKRGEEEWLRVTQEMSEEQRVTREQLAAERKAHEAEMAEQARRFAKEKDDMLRELAREREENARTLAREREDARRALQQEREKLTREIDRERATLARERSALDRERKSFEREREKARRRIADKLALLEGQERQLQPVSPAELALLADDELVDQLRDYASDAADSRQLPAGAATMPARGGGRVKGWWNRARANRSWRRNGLVALALFAAGAVASVAHSRGTQRQARAQAQAETLPPAQQQLPVVDSLAGLAVPPDTIGPPEAPSATSVSRRSGDGARREQPARRADDAPQPPAPGLGVQPPPESMPPMPFVRVDTLARPGDPPRRDTQAVGRDTFARRDTFLLPRRDTVIPLPRPPRPDTIRPGSGV